MHTIVQSVVVAFILCRIRCMDQERPLRAPVQQTTPTRDNLKVALLRSAGTGRTHTDSAMSGFDPTNPFAAPSPAQPAGAAAAPNPFGSDPFGGDSNPFQAPAAPGAGAGRQRAGTSPFVAAVPDPFASASQRRASEAVPPSPWGSAIGSDAFAAAPVAPSVRPSDPFVSVAR